MRQSELLGLEALKALGDEKTSDRELLTRSLNHEVKCVAYFNDMEAEELRSLKIEAAERENRTKQMFEQLRTEARAKISMIETHLKNLEGNFKEVAAVEYHKEVENVTQLKQLTG